MLIGRRRAIARSLLAVPALALPGLALPGLAASPARADGGQRVRIGVLRLSSSGAVFIAKSRGYFADAGLDAELVFFDAAQPIALAAASGDIDIGVSAFTTALFTLARRGALSVIAGQSREAPGYPLIGYLASTHAPAASKFYRPQDFVGHTIGITQTGSTFQYSLGLLADKYHFPLDQVRLTALQSLANVAAAVRSGTVDGALLPVTTARPLLDSGDARLLGWVGDITPWQLGAAFVSGGARANTGMITRFLTAYRRGLHEYHDVLLAAEQDGVVPVTAQTQPLLAMIAEATGQSIEQVRIGLPYVDPDGRLDLADVANQIAWNQKQGFLDRGFGLDQVIDRRFVTY